ncbi:MAG: hypothetical protein GY832_23730 [Chloroflexi bacterium]|nr:hypothetical protein [Chloroflexota bacterium]
MPSAVHIVDSNSRTAKCDSSTNSLQTIEYEHHEIHSGSSYTMEHNAAGGSGTKATISFTTPNTTKWLHMVITARANVEAFYTLGEGATITGASGADYAPRNKNRNSANTSGVISAGSAGGAGNATIGGTVTNFGTTLEMLHFGKGRQQPGASHGENEWILKQNTTYAFEVETEAASSEATVELHWYEHTDKTA